MSPAARIGIDTVVVAGRLGDNVRIELTRPTGWGRIHSDLRHHRALGRAVTRHGISGPRGTYLEWVPETREMSVRLSIPRLAYPIQVESGTANYPLRSCPDANLDLLCYYVLLAIGWKGPRRDVDHVRLLGLHNMVVKNVAFAADVAVADPVELMRAMGSLRRKRAGRCHEFKAHGVVTGLEWDSEAARLQIYGKAGELADQATRERDDSRRSVLRSLTSHAEHVVRVEYTCKTARAVRAIFGVGGTELPRLRRVFDPDVAAYVIGRELDRLGILCAGNVTRRKLPKERALGLDFTRARDGLLESGERLGRRTSITGSHLLSLVGLHVLSGHFTDAEFRSKFGLSSAVLRELKAELRGLGLPSTGTARQTVRQSLADLVRQLRPLITLEPPALAPEDTQPAPWAERPADVGPLVADYTDVLESGWDESNPTEDAEVIDSLNVDQPHLESAVEDICIDDPLEDTAA